MPFEINFTFVWLVMAVALAIIELNTTTLVSLWFVIGSLFALLTSFITDNLIIQFLVFCITSCVCLVFSRPLADKILNKKTPTNIDRIIGKTCFVIESITSQEKGRVKIDGLTWLAQSDIAIEKGQKAIVKGIAGVTLVVEPVKTMINN